MPETPDITVAILEQRSKAFNDARIARNILEQQYHDAQLTVTSLEQQLNSAEGQVEQTRISLQEGVAALANLRKD